MDKGQSIREERALEFVRFTGKHIGSFTFRKREFPKEVFHFLDNPQFQELFSFEKHNEVSRALYEAIKEAKSATFLLPEVVHFITHVRKWISTYHLSSFEFWLIHFVDEISEEEKSLIRGKITGKWMPRSMYQAYFPIGGGSTFPGPHYSLAHYSPDLDTSVASFACFLAAFSARIGEGRHHWFLPGGPPKASVEIDLLFKKSFGESVFDVLAMTRSTLSISSLDLISQKRFIKKKLSTPSHDVDHKRDQTAIVVIDEMGCYKGDWRSIDVESVRGVITLFLSMLTTFQNAFVAELIALFATSTLKSSHLQDFMKLKLNEKLNSTFSQREFTSEHRIRIERFVSEVLKIKSGYGLTYDEFMLAMDKHGFGLYREKCMHLASSKLFDKEGILIEKREVIFKELERILTLQSESMHKFYAYVDSLETSLLVKERVFGHEPHFLSHTSEIEEIKEVMNHYQHLTVNYEEKGKLYPMGVIYHDEVQSKNFATVSWNDFSNPKETDMREGIEVISFVDHHKSEVHTGKPSFGIVRDVQSSNTIFASLSFSINDKYSTGGMTLEEINRQIDDLKKGSNTPREFRLLQRLFMRREAFHRQGDYFVSYDREVFEYLTYLYAILEDTDLLSKVTEEDVERVLDLINRLKSLKERKEVEAVDFDDLSRSDPFFVTKAKERLLQNNDLYSLYSIVYEEKEKRVDQILKNAAKGKDVSLFQDTKIVPPTSVSVGQFKYFSGNEKVLLKESPDIREIWIERCRNQAKMTPEVNVYIFMMTTMPSAKDLFSGFHPHYKYKDEIWIWVSDEKRSKHTLSNFLKGFFTSNKILKQEPEVHFLGKKEIFESLSDEAIKRGYTKKSIKASYDMMIIQVDPMSITSRKSDIAPYL